MNEGFCKAAHGFTFIFLNGTYCEINISSCAEPELSMALCLNGTICVEGPGHTLCCRSEYIYPEMITYEIMKVIKFSPLRYSVIPSLKSTILQKALLMFYQIPWIQINSSWTSKSSPPSFYNYFVSLCFPRILFLFFFLNISSHEWFKNNSHF